MSQLEIFRHILLWTYAKCFPVQQAVPGRAIRGSGVSVNGALPPLLTAAFRRGLRDLPGMRQPAGAGEASGDAAGARQSADAAGDAATAQIGAAMLV